MERVAPRALNYDEVLPLAISSRANRRTFNSTNGSVFSNATGATICKIDVNADSMLDASHSYLQVRLNCAGPDLSHLLPEIGPAFIQRLVITSGGQVIEDINEYGRLYAGMLINQTSPDYARNVLGSYGLVPQIGFAGATQSTAATGRAVPLGETQSFAEVIGTGATGVSVTGVTLTQSGEVGYLPGPESIMRGRLTTGVAASTTGKTTQLPLQKGLDDYVRTSGAIKHGTGRTITIPLLSGFLNMDKYVPLIMMNAGFTIEIHLAAANRAGVELALKTGTADADVSANALWSIDNVKYVAQLIDLDASFYGKLRAVMEASGGSLQLAGQTYRHYAGQLGKAESEYTISLPARVKSIKSVFACFLDSTLVNEKTCYNTSVFQNANLQQFRFEIGSVRYPASDVKCSAGNHAETTSELHKAFGRLGDYAHSSCVRPKSLECIQEQPIPLDGAFCGLQGFMLGYDFESFQRVALESGINTADRSLPINFIASKGATTDITQVDFYVLSDAIYYVNSDGTVSVSV